MDNKQLLRQLWDLQANQTTNGTACRFQMQTPGGPVEYLVCSKAVMLDYAPAATLEPGKLFTVNHLPLKKLEDRTRVNPEIMLCEESLTIHKDEHIECGFLPLNTYKEVGLGVFDTSNGRAVLQTVLPYTKNGSFQFAGLAFHSIPDVVRWELNKNGSLTALNAQIGKMRSGPVLVLLLSCETALLISTMSKAKNDGSINENIYFDAECQERYRLDGYREEEGVYSRVVKGKSTLKGLKNPVARKAEEETAAPQITSEPQTTAPEPVKEEPQVEDIKPEQAEEIAEKAPDITPEKAEPEQPKEELKKRTRTRRTANGKQDNEKVVGLLDELIAYFSAPIPDWMSQELMQAEARKLRDLGVAIARRQSNLFTAATASEKKLRDVLKGVLGN